MTPERHSLARVIGRDLFRYGIIPMILLAAIIISAVFVVTTAHETRLLTAAKDKLYEEKDFLDIEWRNLILEENALASHSRVERLSVEKLRMVHVEPSQENIIVSKQ
ncbi:TPA: cell division protein FtsL [Providencia alcalifaciens]|uniref:Cell division protein FtsL n=3 Tax=Providencia alcalifaciens TaxID=126385 RepID=A0AAW9V7S9_9GAMM|nr:MULTISPECIES: cell division protein FtsL [Providencia]ATG16604.1 cell division protein FtsL [Providencia alcalifaciens]EEB44194.1 cell division protein FtsL [Providencia alcalifaciens DSM 30120]EKT66972.1 cell division protein FtsL [Providencia alcalifaciens Dmel2]ETT07430.1 cell division protein FtsL [Providencia alcalifaciens F90-2004]EUC96477.1 cell division protein FtsL [Providencia alcalifaciens PAL-2]